MSSVADAITKTIPISQFNRGLAGKIFSDVKKEGAKVVMKNNTAEAVLISPDEYIEMMDDLNDYYLLTLALERMTAFNPDELISLEELEKEMHITPEELDRIDEVEFE